MVCGIIKEKLWIIIKRSILDPARSLKDTMERYQFFENPFSEDVGSALFGGNLAAILCHQIIHLTDGLEKMGDSESKKSVVEIREWRVTTRTIK